jgi:hypothetical protein
MYSVELNEQIKLFDCPDCGKKSMTVWGFVSKDNTAHAVYYAGSMTGHNEPSVRLTVSIGRWGVDNPDEENVQDRHWIFIEARPTTDSYEMMVREPEESFCFDKRILGSPMARRQALASSVLEEFFAVADFIAFNDPAVESYLCGQPVSSEGRKPLPGVLNE